MVLARLVRKAADNLLRHLIGLRLAPAPDTHQRSTLCSGPVQGPHLGHKTLLVLDRPRVVTKHHACSALYQILRVFT